MDEETATSEIGRLYPAVYRAFKADGRRVGTTGLTARMLNVLQHLVTTGGPMTIGELADHLGLSKATTSELIDRIEERGLLERFRDGRDRRRVFVWVTEQGQAQAAGHPQVLAEDALAHAVRAMEPDAREQLVEGLRALLRAAGKDES